MIIKVEQTNSNLKNKFQIKINNEVKYLAGTPWMDIDSPFEIDKIRKCIFTKADESLLYYVTSYNVLENVSNTIIPMKWAFTGEQKVNIFSVHDNQNNICGKFYNLINGILDTKYAIEYKDDILKCYDVSVGKTRNILIYNEERQIAEIVKPMHTYNNLDYYYIFLLDEYSELEKILSFFTIYIDYEEYSNNGEIVTSKREVKVRYSWNAGNKFYDKNWIVNHFNKEEIELINKQMSEERKKIKNKIKKQSQYLILAIVISWIFLLILTMIMSIAQNNI